MALTYEELESVTEDYFKTDGGKAEDIYFNTSFLLNYLLKQMKGLWERPSGGMKIRVPLEYDGQESGFYEKGDTLSSDDRESVNAAYFEWKHAYGNATVYRIDQLKNAGDYAQVQLVTQRLAGAQKTITKTLADSIYDAAGAGSTRLTGLLALCNETTATQYGGLAEDDVVAADATKPWEGIMGTTAAALTTTLLRTIINTGHVRDGAKGDPDLFVTTRDLFNFLKDQLQVQQRFVKSEDTAKAGFKGLEFEGTAVFPDDYCPSGYGFALNSNYLGFAVHQDGLFMKSKWAKIPDSAEDKSMKIYFDGNMICSNRKSCAGDSGLLAA